jgi:phospholipid N-methyltransferase
MTHTLATNLNFLWAGLVKHGQTGGIVPSQRFLIAAMIAPVPADYCGSIIELGAGTGVLTLRLADRCPGARILACEINPTLARTTQARLSRAGHRRQVKLVSNSAENLFPELDRLGMAKPGFIISGIPLGNLGREKAGRLLDAIRQALDANGMYIQFQHSLLDRKKIQSRFPNTRTVAVWVNFPPAVVYYARS